MGAKKKKEQKRAEIERKIEKLGRKLEKSLRKRADLEGGAVAGEGVEWLSPEAPPDRGRARPDVARIIRERRSIKRFTERPVTREEIEALLDAATWAPNHRMTEPWRFYVLGPEARRAYGAALGARKAKKVADGEAAALVLDKVAREHEALPAMIAVAMKTSEDAERLREDYAATFMAIQNMGLVAAARGLGTHIKTGAVMDDPAARSAVAVPEDERIVAVVNVGEPADIPEAKARVPAPELTVWTD